MVQQQKITSVSTPESQEQETEPIMFTGFTKLDS